MMRAIVVLVFSCVFGLAAQAQMRLELSSIAPEAPVSGDIDIGVFSEADDRLTFPMQLNLPQLWSELDALAISQGNLGSSDVEVTWLGPTKVLSHTETGLHLTSKARLRTQVTLKLLGRELIETFDVERNFDVEVVPVWDQATRTLEVRMRLLRVHDLPAWADPLLRDFAEPYAQQISLFAASDADLDALELEVSNVKTVALGSGGAQLGADVSVNAQTGRSAIFQQLYRNR